ncbi:MAG: hypothetical protein KAW02_03785 [candidate division Zixibacteria bacterium]|nr:hypothetical protein [candidate division Zixibacteria bacterium]
MDQANFLSVIRTGLWSVIIQKAIQVTEVALVYFTITVDIADSERFRRKTLSEQEIEKIIYISEIDYVKIIV